MIWAAALLFVVSLALNTFFVWYGWRLLKQLLFVSDSFGDLFERIDEFKTHLKIVYEMETFYGDETLRNLIIHSRELKRYMDKFRYLYSLTEPYEEEDEEEDEYFDEEEDFDDFEEEEKKAKTRTTVFHSGS